MKWLPVLAGLSLLILIAYWVSPARVVYTLDRSIAYKWWIEVVPWREPRVGDYILFEPPVRNEYTKDKFLVKRVVCGEGQVIRTSGRDFYCDNTYLGRAREKDSRGREAKPVELNQVVGRGYYFVMGESESSYDSRYMGLIPREKVKKLMFPLAKGPSFDFLFLKNHE